MKKIICSLILLFMVSCTIVKQYESSESEVEQKLPTRIEVVSDFKYISLGNYSYIIKDNVTGNEFIVVKYIESVAICPIK